MDSRVRRDASGRTAHRSVSVITEEAVFHPRDSVCVARDTQERGQYMHRNIKLYRWRGEQHHAVNSQAPEKSQQTLND